MKKVNRGEDILIAARALDTETLLRILPGATPKEINYKDASEKTALIWACDKGHVPVAELLLQNKADPNLQDEWSNTALIMASVYGHVAVVELLLENEADPNINGHYGNTALIMAAQYGHVAIIKLLLQSKAAINLQNEGGNTALVMACDKGHVGVVELLLRKGADPDIKNKLGEIAADATKNREIKHMLHFGVNMEEQETISPDSSPRAQEPVNRGEEILIAARALDTETLLRILPGATPKEINFKDAAEKTALIWACDKGHVPVAELLLQNKADPNVQDEWNSTALIIASVCGYAAVVELLLENKADPNIKNHYGNTALILASQDGHVAIIKLLLQNKAAINLQNEGGNTALVLACEKGHVGVVELLLRKGADPDINNKYGNTALILASQDGHVAIIKLLLQNKAAINLQNEGGNTALVLACKKGHVGVVELLLRKGADPDIKNKLGEIAADATEIREIKHMLHFGVNMEEQETISPVSSPRAQQPVPAAEASTDNPPTGAQEPVAATAASTDQSKDTAVTDMMAAAIQYGSKEWRRSKLSFVGEGRAGKTAVTNSVTGKSFQETASTVGISQLTCDVKQIKSGGTQDQEQLWAECVPQEPEWERAIAEMVAASKHKKTDAAVQRGADIRAYMATLASSTARAVTSDPDNEEGAAGSDVQDKVTAASAVTEQNRKVAAPLPVPAVGTPFNPQTTSTTSTAPVTALPSKAPSSAETRSPELQPVAEQTGERVLDESVVMRMLATMQDAETGLLISLFDFGGQSVFDVIHHLFLTRNGAYALVFNMEWLVNEGPEKDKALRFMRSWLSSIAVHTYSTDSQMTAPIVIVGTRLDKISNAVDHEKISTILHDHFSDNLAWRSVISNGQGRDRNGRALQWFFPVDNTLGASCDGMKRLMSVVHSVIDKAEYTHKEVPLTWLKVIDQMADRKKDCLLLSDLTSLCQRNGVSAQELPYMLAFLHDMGHLMWLDEPGLRDVVVLDPVSYLVTPATIIICKLTPDFDDATHHFMDCHRECERLHKREWVKLKRDGVLHTLLLPVLWRDYVAHREVLLQLMVKFGLLVPLRTQSTTTDDIVTQYLVPTLLFPASLQDPSVAQWTDQHSSSCYLVFTLVEDLEQSSTLTEADLRSSGFLPGGIFERIVGKALSWSQDTTRGSSINLESVLLHKDVVVLAFGRQRFRLVHCPDLHCVRVDIEGNHPIGIQQRLLEFSCKIIDECMRSLHCFVAVCLSTSAEKEKTIKELLPSELLIPLQQLRKASKGESMLTRRGGRNLVSLDEIMSRYGQWLQLFELRNHYDVFISYRWGAYDSAFTEQLFDMFTNYSIGHSNRAVEVFLDRKRLREGRKFKSDFCAALTHCTVALPIVSIDALVRMVGHNPSFCDNVLLEWIVILECFAAKRLQKVFPILFGERVVSGLQNNEVIVRDFFAHPFKDQLPHASPTATLSEAAVLLGENGMMPSEQFSTYTVHSVVNALLLFLLCKASDIPGSDAHRVQAVSDRVMELLADCRETSSESEGLPPIATVTAPAATADTTHSSSPVPASRAMKALADLTVAEMCVLLEKVNLSNLVGGFTAKQVSGMMLSFCETVADLQGEDIGITSALMARGLLKLIGEWKEQGVCLQ